MVENIQVRTKGREADNNIVICRTDFLAGRRYKGWILFENIDHLKCKK